MKEFSAVLGAGAFGGLLSWIWTITLGVELDRLSRGIAVLACVLLGAGAAVIGIYVVAKTDRRDLPHALGFAVLCGFSWQLVYETGLSTIQRHDARKEIEQRASSAAGAAQAVASTTAPPEVKAQAVGNLAADAAAVLESSKQAGSKEAEEKATDVAVTALDALGKSETAAPEKTATAVEQIGEAAIDAGHVEVAEKAVETLKVGGVTESEARILKRFALKDPRLRATIGQVVLTQPNQQ